MKVKSIVLITCLAIPAKDYAQTAINERIPVKAGQTIRMDFDYPELISVTSWDGNEVLIQGSVSINGGENDDAFVIEKSVGGDIISINAHIRDLKKLPQRVIVYRDGQKMMFRDKAELQKYQAEHGRGYNSMSWGPEIDIQLEVRVPRDMATEIRSVYGMVEVKNFRGPLSVDATYGGVDASLAEKTVGQLTAETNFGNIYTDLDIKFSSDEVRTRDFHTIVSARPGSGPKYNFESKYGNVYLRKERN